MACPAELPHMSAAGRRLAHTAGRSGLVKMRQRLASSSCTQRTPAGLPNGMPGMGEEMEGAMQQAPQWDRQCIFGVEEARDGRFPILLENRSTRDVAASRLPLSQGPAGPNKDHSESGQANSPVRQEYLRSPSVMLFRDVAVEVVAVLLAG